MVSNRINGIWITYLVRIACEIYRKRAVWRAEGSSLSRPILAVEAADLSQIPVKNHLAADLDKWGMQIDRRNALGIQEFA